MFTSIIAGGGDSLPWSKGAVTVTETTCGPEVNNVRTVRVMPDVRRDDVGDAVLVEVTDGDIALHVVSGVADGL